MDKVTLRRKQGAARAKLRKAGIEPTDHLVQRTVEGMYVPPDPNPIPTTMATTAQTGASWSMSWDGRSA